MSSALLTFAQRVTIQAYDANSNLVGAPVNIQVTNSEPSSTMNDVDLTNTESGGFAEWAPTTLISEFSIDGVVDTSLNPDLIWITAMQTKVFCQVVLYLVKPNLNANSITYAGNVLFKSFKLTNRTQANGEVVRFSAQGRVVGKWVKGGTSLTGAAISGFVQN